MQDFKILQKKVNKLNWKKKMLQQTKYYIPLLQLLNMDILGTKGSIFSSGEINST